MALAFLSETGGPDIASRVPLRTVPELVALLQKRIFAANAEEIVQSRLFCGLPLYFRSRFVLQTILRLVEQSGAHCATAWRTPLPELVSGLLEGELPSDAEENKPFGSPEALDLALPCAEALLKAEGAGSPESRASLEVALRLARGSDSSASALLLLLLLPAGRAGYERRSLPHSK